jgi:toxin-antitoxin system PIN domain toxin
LKSLDTNVLYYATNTACPEHEKARGLLESATREPTNWILAEQVLLEYYRLVRNPAVLAKPLGAAEAAEKLRFFRDEMGCRHCSYDRGCWEDVIVGLAEPSFPARRVFDLVLAATLRRNGVDTFYTRNILDFQGLGWFQLIDPIA